MNNGFGERIKEFRIGLSLTQSEFADKLGVTQAALSAYENGTRQPTYETLISISKEFNISVDWLCGLSERETLDDKITTYKQLFKALVDITDNDKLLNKWTVDVTSNLKNSKTEFSTNDKNIAFFMEGYQHMKYLLDTYTIEKSLFDLWLNDKLNEYDYPIETFPFT